MRFFPTRLDPLHVKTVSDGTFRRYQQAVEKFDTFLQRYDAAPECAAEFDEWLCLFREEAALTRSQLEVTLAGVQFFAPRLRGGFLCTKRVIKGLHVENPPKHAFPMLSRTAKFLASKMAELGMFRLAVCMLLQQATGLRPSEVLGLHEHDVIRPTSMVPRYVLRLGTCVGTKVRREQTVFFDPAEDRILGMLFMRLLRATSSGGSLACCGYDVYRRLLARLSLQLGVPYTPHSCRAGFATEAIIKGRKPDEVQRQGRWASVNSFLVYIDVATALQVEAEYRSQALRSEIEAVASSLLRWFPKHCFAGQTDGIAGDCGDRRRFGGRIRSADFSTARFGSGSGNDAATKARQRPVGWLQRLNARATGQCCCRRRSS